MPILNVLWVWMPFAPNAHANAGAPVAATANVLIQTGNAWRE
jgi:hypothetical protein